MNVSGHVRTTTIGIGQLRSDTCRYVQRVECGEAFQILRRGRAAAELCAAPLSRDLLLLPVAHTDLRVRAAHFFDRVAAGETIAVEYHGRVVAVLRPCDNGAVSGPVPSETLS